MSEPSDAADAAVNEERVNDFREHCKRLRHKSDLSEVESICRLSKIRSLCLHLTEAAEREKIMEAQVTRALMYGATGGDGAGPSRAELEAQVAALKEKNAELREKNGKLEGENKVLREQSEVEPSVLGG